jgi:hypothetical protein
MRRRWIDANDLLEAAHGCRGSVVRMMFTAQDPQTTRDTFVRAKAQCRVCAALRPRGGAAAAKAPAVRRHAKPIQMRRRKPGHPWRVSQEGETECLTK